MAIKSSLFKYKKINSYLLQNKLILNGLIAEGYCWIRQYAHSNFNEIIRNPTVGCIIELYTTEYTGTVPIDSKEGKKLIHKLCYF